jgi:MFS family permease
VLIAIGMALFAQMSAATARNQVLLAMIVAGVGMGLLMPVYTVAVQNVAPRRHMGAATASTTFFRSIGSTVGVALFGSVLLTNYHQEFAKSVPPDTPQETLSLFSNPLLLSRMGPQLEATFGQYKNGAEILHQLLENVRTALSHGIQLIFFASAVVMAGMIVLNLLLKSVPLRSGPSSAATEVSPG